MPVPGQPDGGEWGRPGPPGAFGQPGSGHPDAGGATPGAVGGLSERPDRDHGRHVRQDAGQLRGVDAVEPVPAGGGAAVQWSEGGRGGQDAGGI